MPSIAGGKRRRGRERQIHILWSKKRDRGSEREIRAANPQCHVSRHIVASKGERVPAKTLELAVSWTRAIWGILDQAPFSLD